MIHRWVIVYAFCLFDCYNISFTLFNSSSVWIMCQQIRAHYPSGIFLITFFLWLNIRPTSCQPRVFILYKVQCVKLFLITLLLLSAFNFIISLTVCACLRVMYSTLIRIQYWYTIFGSYTRIYISNTQLVLRLSTFNESNSTALCSSSVQSVLFLLVRQLHSVLDVLLAHGLGV